MEADPSPKSSSGATQKIIHGVQVAGNPRKSNTLLCTSRSQCLEIQRFDIDYLNGWTTLLYRALKRLKFNSYTFVSRLQVNRSTGFWARVWEMKFADCSVTQQLFSCWSALVLLKLVLQTQFTDDKPVLAMAVTSQQVASRPAACLEWNTSKQNIDDYEKKKSPNTVSWNLWADWSRLWRNVANIAEGQSAIRRKLTRSTTWNSLGWVTLPLGQENRW